MSTCPHARQRTRALEARHRPGPIPSRAAVPCCSARHSLTPSPAFPLTHTPTYHLPAGYHKDKIIVYQVALATEPCEVVAIDINGSEFNVLHGWGKLRYPVARDTNDAIAVLRAPAEEKEGTLADHSEWLLARVGRAALALQIDPDEDVAASSIRGAHAATRLVFRLLVIAAVLIAAMTLYGLTQ